MALHGYIRINDIAIVGYYIVRLAPTFTMPDSICTYRWEVQRIYNGTVLRTNGYITDHRFGDGAEVLLSRVLAIAGPRLIQQQNEIKSKEPM